MSKEGSRAGVSNPAPSGQLQEFSFSTPDLTTMCVCYLVHGVCVCVCVCALGWFKCRAQIPSMVTILGRHVTQFNLTGGSVSCSRAPQSWVLKVEESAHHLLPHSLRLEPATFGLQVQLSNHKVTTAPFLIIIIIIILIIIIKKIIND